jgi:hypothetical protein
MCLKPSTPCKMVSGLTRMSRRALFRGRTGEDGRQYQVIQGRTRWRPGVYRIASQLCPILIAHQVYAISAIMNTNRNNLFTRKGELCALRGPTREKGSSHVHLCGVSPRSSSFSLSHHMTLAASLAQKQKFPRYTYLHQMDLSD